ncbi:MAG TPA: ATPase [Prevotella sp.]|nr:ATPase [Prevotella sp.]
MGLKEVLQSLIAMKQEEMPFKLLPRDQRLPVDSRKIITVPGVRRCGKSSLLMLAINELIDRGVEKNRILWLSFDDERIYDLKTKDLDTVIQAYMEMYPDIDISSVYMFFDEIQLVENWDLFILRLYKSYCKNIFISGSNSKMLSTELSSVLRGWPIEYEEFPLSFREFCDFTNVKANRFTESGRAKLLAAFKKYNSGSAFPQIVLEEDDSIRYKELQNYFNTMLFRDLVEHYNLSNSMVIRYLLKRVMLNLSKPTSVNAIYNDLKSQGLRISKESLYLIMDYACSIFLFFKVPKFSGSMIKETSSLSKYYLIDNGLRSAVLMPQSEDEGKLFENSVFLYLRRYLKTGEKIYYYKEKNECDFVIQSGNVISRLIQVTTELNGSNKNREIAGLLEASKYTGCDDLTIITLSQEDSIPDNGRLIKVIPAWKWMLER